MRNNPWPPTAVFNLETAPVRIPVGTCGFLQRRRPSVRNAGRQTLLRSEYVGPVGDRFLRAYRSWRQRSWFSGPGWRGFAGILPDVAGNQYPIRTEKTSSETALSFTPTGARTQADRPVGGIALLLCHREKASGTSFKNSCLMESRLSRSSLFTGWKVGALEEFTKSRLAFRAPFMRFL
jgi:hypothetical protein